MFRRTTTFLSAALIIALSGFAGTALSDSSHPLLRQGETYQFDGVLCFAPVAAQEALRKIAEGKQKELDADIASKRIGCFVTYFIATIRREVASIRITNDVWRILRIDVRKFAIPAEEAEESGFQSVAVFQPPREGYFITTLSLDGSI